MYLFRRFFVVSLFLAANSQAIELQERHPAYELGVKLAECNAFYALAAEQFAGMGRQEDARDMRQASSGARITSQLAFIQYGRQQAAAEVDHVKLAEAIASAQRARLERLHAGGGFPAISDEAYACNDVAMVQNAMLQELNRRLADR